VKLPELSDKERYNALNEVRILASVKASNIIGYKEVFLTDTSCTLWYFFNPSIIMEYSDNGDLYQKISTHQT
jgi:NIMA (never in mitosis gene a)-related kinase 1/4/5